MKNFIYLLTLAVFIGSCSPSIPNQLLVPANITSAIKYMPKPILNDSLKSKTYVQAHYQALDEADDGESFLKIRAVEFSVSRAHTFKNIQVAYGTSLTAGSAKYSLFKANGDFLNSEKKGFNSVVINGSVNGVIKSNGLEFRYLSLDFGYSKEFGDYAKARQAFLQKEYYTVVPNSSFGTVGLGSELCFTDGILQLALKIGIAKNVNRVLYVQEDNAYYKNKEFGYLSAHVGYKKLNFTAEVSNNLARAGIGFGF